MFFHIIYMSNLSCLLVYSFTCLLFKYYLISNSSNKYVLPPNLSSTKST